MKETYTYEENFKIRSSEVNPNGKAKLPSICYLLQETAGNHALKLNFDISQLKEQNLTWVLHRLHVVMDRFPEWRDRITIKTWPSSGDSLRAYRDFCILDSQGNEIGRSLSYWLMLNVDNRRPVRMTEEILDMAPSNIDHVIKVQKDRIKKPGKMAGAKNFTVRRNDLDVNHHVNNVKYIEWALEALPQGHNITEIDIEFRSECKLGEKVRSEFMQLKESDKNLHQIIRTRDEKIAAVAETTGKQSNDKI